MLSSTGLSAEDRKSFRILDAKWDGRSSFKAEEAAEILSLSKWAVYEAIKRGEIAVVWVGRRCIVPRIALERKLVGAEEAA
jgi:excisionase family DNA binding protein